MENKVRNSVDCICDLPQKMQKELDVSMMKSLGATEELMK